MCSFSRLGPSSIVSQPPSVRPPPFKPPVKRELWWWDPEEQPSWWQEGSLWKQTKEARRLVAHDSLPITFRAVLEAGASGSGGSPLRRPGGVIVEYLVEPGSGRLWSEWHALTTQCPLGTLAYWGWTFWEAEFWNRRHSLQQAANPAASS